VHRQTTLNLVASGVPAVAPRPAGERRIAAAFAASRRAGRSAALMPFLMGGFPTLDAARRIAEACADNGADLVELGIPCADAALDGPVISAAGAAALRAGATVEGVLEVARRIAQRLPVVIMCYANVVQARGAWAFAGDLRAAGVSGLLVPDLPPQDSAELLAACDACDVALVPIVAPATADLGAARICARARGFVYAISVAGKTGERPTLASGAGEAVRRARLHSSVPVALGFGISTPAHAAQAASAGAEGVIVGSRLVRAAAQAADPAAAVGALVARFAAALAPAPADRLWEAQEFIAA
jgi:tryptophan synthase alpha chain